MVEVGSRKSQLKHLISSWKINMDKGLSGWFNQKKIPGGGRVLPYMSYIGMCGPKEYGFSAVLVTNGVSILAYFGHFGHNYGFCTL